MFAEKLIFESEIKDKLYKEYFLFQWGIFLALSQKMCHSPCIHENSFIKTTLYEVLSYSSIIFSQPFNIPHLYFELHEQCPLEYLGPFFAKTSQTLNSSEAASFMNPLYPKLLLSYRNYQS